MPFSRKPLLAAAVAVQCLTAGFAAAAPAPVSAAKIPAAFFKQWKTSKNCTEQHAGLAAQVSPGLKLGISQDVQAGDGSYVLQAEDVGELHWAANWNGMKLQYRPGKEMKTLPADFECIPGQEASSSFLAMSNFAQATEPQYELAHWYGMARIHGQLEHVLIFPSSAPSGPKAVIVMQSVVAPGTVQLDANGVIYVDD
jgi:hypothetical protein